MNIEILSLNGTFNIASCFSHFNVHGFSNERSNDETFNMITSFVISVSTGPAVNERSPKHVLLRDQLDVNITSPDKHGSPVQCDSARLNLD